jgi:branched-subunit amino acid ABC-type transport system permease component
MQQTATDEEMAEVNGVGAGALWPWALFAAALLAGLGSFFAYTPR